MSRYFLRTILPPQAWCSKTNSHWNCACVCNLAGCLLSVSYFFDGGLYSQYPFLCFPFFPMVMTVFLLCPAVCHKFFFSICKTNQVKPLPRAPSFWAHSARWHMPWTWIHNPLHAKCAHSCFHFHHARSPHWWWSEASRSCSLVKVENGVPKLNSLEFRSPWKFAQCEHCTNSKNTRKWPKRNKMLQAWMSLPGAPGDPATRHLA